MIIEKYQIYSTAPSNLPASKFINPLQQAQIELAVDVRSLSHRQYNPCSNQEVLGTFLKDAGIAYHCDYMRLGSCHKEPACYKNGCKLNDKVGYSHPLQHELR